MQQSCDHINQITEVTIGEEYLCEECMKVGGTWMHLRTCQTCGVTLCCDQSPNQHITAHYHATDHPVIASAEPGERWLWCYPDEQFVEY